MRELIAFVASIFLTVGLGWGQSRVSSLIESVHRNADLLFARGCLQGEATITSSGKIVYVTHHLWVISDTRTSRNYYLAMRIKVETTSRVTATVDAVWWAEGEGFSKFQPISADPLDLLLQQLFFSSNSTFLIYVTPISRLRSVPTGLWFVFSPAAGGYNPLKISLSLYLCAFLPPACREEKHPKLGIR